ncbi:MAG: AMP-binding protein, partial [Bifidobacteriaceae bacterium]|nr:AMP-binding protein [Bifidobacteriaceae bacterium]
MSIPANTEVDSSWNIISMFQRRLENDPDQTLIEIQQADGNWTPISAQQFDADVKAVAKGLVALGVQPEHRIAIMSRTSYEWTLLDYAIWTAGAVPVPIYETSSVDQVHWICSDANVFGVFAETSAHAMIIEAARADLPSLKQVWQLGQGAISALKQVGTRVEDAEIEQRRTRAQGQDLATIIYTSGTTGRPKGTELTH